MTAEMAVIFIAEERKLDLLLNLSRLADSTSEIVELRTTNLTLAEYFNLLNVGRMDGEGLLNTYAVRNTSYSKGLGDSAAVLSDNGHSTRCHRNSKPPKKFCGAIALPDPKL